MYDLIRLGQGSYQTWYVFHTLLKKSVNLTHWNCFQWRRTITIAEDLYAGSACF